MGYLDTKLTAARTVEAAYRSAPGEIPKGHVRLRLAAASLCGTDLHYYSDFANAGFELRNPVTLGHEACAWVDDPNGSDLGPGQLVALNPVMNCQECDPCRRGEENLCTAKSFPGSATTVPHIDGFFRQIIDHPARCCRPAGNGVDPRHLTFAEPLACALHALNAATTSAGRRVLVTGCGPMGLLAIAAAAGRGAHVTAIDLRKEAVDVALAAGAETGLIAGRFDHAEIEGSFDAAVEASGAVQALNAALRALRPGGRLSVLSFVQPAGAEVMFNLITLKEIEVVGSFQFNREFEDAVRLIEAGDINVEALTARAFPLEETGDALRFMAKGEACGKVLLLGDTESR